MVIAEPTTLLGAVHQVHGLAVPLAPSQLKRTELQQQIPLLYTLKRLDALALTVTLPAGAMLNEHAQCACATYTVRTTHSFVQTRRQVYSVHTTG